MKPRKPSDQQEDVRRSTRIRVNAVKRKTEEEELKEVQKKLCKEDKDSYFSIFDKKKPKNGSQPPRKVGRPPKQKAEPVKTKAEGKEVNLTLIKTKDLKNGPKQVIDLADDDVSPQSVETKTVPEFNFISSFVENELPLSTFPNHIQQIGLNANNYSDLQYYVETSSDEVLFSEKHSIRSVNGYFSSSSGSKTVNHEIEQQSKDHRTWVDKYKPKSARTVAGHASQVEILASWLAEWRQKLKPKATTNSDSSNSCFSYDGSDDEVGMLKCVALTGHCGTGKTSAVYAVARELGFKVFEVSPSSSRVGRHLLQQLQEATLSHHVQGVPKISPFFKNFTKVVQNDVSASSVNISADLKLATEPNTKKIVKPKLGAITNYFRKSTSPVQEPNSQPEKKVSKKTTMLSFFKPQSKDLVNDELQTAKHDNSNNIRKDTNLTNKISSRGVDDVEIVDEVVSSIDNATCTAVHKSSDENLDFEVLSDSPSSKVVNIEVSAESDCTTVIKENCVLKKRKGNDTEETSGNAAKVDDATEVKESHTLKKRKKKEKLELQQSNAGSLTTVDDATALSPEMGKLKFCSLSVILFDDADISLEVDEGFWSSINSFLKVTRKPVVLTASQNIQELCNNINSEVSIIKFDNIHEGSALAHLQEINRTEQLGLCATNLMLLFKHCNQDIRQSLLQLQFWGAIGKREIDYSQLFGLPILVMCLDSRVSENILHWIFTWNNLQATELVFSSFAHDLNILHRNINLWLPFKKIEREERVVPIKPPKKYKRLDVSWFSDEDSDNDDGESTAIPMAEIKNEEKEPQLLPSLLSLSQLYNEFGDSDLIRNSGYDCSNSFWLGNVTTHAKQPYSHDLSTEIASWVTLLSAKACWEKLQNLPENNLHLFVENDNILNIKPQVTNSKSLRSQQNIADGVLSSQKLNHRALCVDYYSMLRTVQKSETVRKQCNTKRSRRFLHYFESCGFTVEMDDLLSISNAFL